jgi:hypothetical protein
MGIRISRIRINWIELKNWLDNDGFVCLEDEEYYPTTYAHQFFDEALQDHYHDEADDHDYTFNDWCEEHEVYTKWDINHQYGSDNWEWEVIENEDGETEWLIIAVKEY